MKRQVSIKNLKTPPCVFSYVFLDEKVEQLNGEMMYSCEMIFTEEFQKKYAKKFAALKAEIKKLVFKKWGKTPPADLDICLRSGNKKRKGEGPYKNAFFIHAKTSNRPGIVDKDKESIMDYEEEIYSGVIGRASINLYTFEKRGNQGVGCSINNLQKFADGPRLDGRLNPDEDFDEDDIPDEFKVAESDEELDDFFN